MKECQHCKRKVLEPKSDVECSVSVLLALPLNVSQPPQAGSASATGSAASASVKNLHIIVGEPRRCICGMYNGEPVGCGDVLASLEALVEHAKIKGSGVSLYAHDILRLEAVIKPLIKECE